MNQQEKTTKFTEDLVEFAQTSNIPEARRLLEKLNNDPKIVGLLVKEYTTLSYLLIIGPDTQEELTQLEAIGITDSFILNCILTIIQKDLKQRQQKAGLIFQENI